MKHANGISVTPQPATAAARSLDLARRFHRWMFSVPSGERSKLKIILWWELRRIPYNIIVGAAGIVSVVMFYFFTANEPIEDGEDIGEPIMLFIAPLLMNAAYTLGWIVETSSRKEFWQRFFDDERETGPRFLTLGLKFSIAVIWVPTLIWAGLWLLRTVGLRH